MTTKPQLHPLLRIKSSRTRRKCDDDDNKLCDEAKLLEIRQEPHPLTRDIKTVMVTHNNSNCDQIISTLNNNNTQNVTYISSKLKVKMLPCRANKFSKFSKFLALAVLLLIGQSLLLSGVNAGGSPKKNNKTLSLTSPVPTSVSKAYTNIPLLPPTYVEKVNISRSAISRPFFTRVTPGDAKPKTTRRVENNNNQLKKPSKLFTNNERDPLMSADFDQAVFDSTTEKLPPTSTRKSSSSFSPFLTQTDTGPKIRLEPFFNILSTFQSLALGSSKEQKFSPSYQAVAEGVGVAEERLKAKRSKKERNKGTKGLRNKNPGSPSDLGKWKGNKGITKFGSEDANGGGPVQITLPKPVVFPETRPHFEEGDDDIITAESLQKDVNPMDVLTVSMSTSMSMGGDHHHDDGIIVASSTPKSKGVVEDVELSPISSPLRLPQQMDSITEPSLGFPLNLEQKSPPKNKRQKSKNRNKNQNNNGRIHISLTDNPNNGNLTTPESRERRLRSENPHFFENFHHTDSESDLLAQESTPQNQVGSNLNANIPPGYALPAQSRDEEVDQMANKYPTSFAQLSQNNHPNPNNNLPPPGLGLPPKSFFSLAGGGNLNGIPYPKRPPFHHHANNNNNYAALMTPSHDPNNHHPYYSQQKPNIYGNLATNHPFNKPPEASTDLGEQQNAADSKLVLTTGGTTNPHQKIGVMDGFDVFFKQYKVLVWGGFFVVSALAFLCLVVFLYTNNPPTEVVTAKGLLTDWLTNPSPEMVNFLSSVVNENEKAGGNGKKKRKRFKMQKRKRAYRPEGEGDLSKKDLLQ